MNDKVAPNNRINKTVKIISHCAKTTSVLNATAMPVARARLSLRKGTPLRVEAICGVYKSFRNNCLRSLAVSALRFQFLTWAMASKVSMATTWLPDEARVPRKSANA